MRVLGIVALDLTLDRFEDRDVIPSGPCLGPRGFLHVQLTRQAVDAMDDQPVRRSVFQRHQ
jgi:hypothetical protein